MTWKVVPLSPGQLLDVRPEDVLDGGDFRKCSTYRGGGGYDRFPDLCEKYLDVRHSEQFVVQLFGCNLDCPYCYVTREGVWGKFKRYTSRELVEAFVRSGQDTFHLMGGAPALQIEHWHEIIRGLPRYATFHSDLLLTEKPYTREVIRSITKPKCLYVVSIKGLTEDEYRRNTRKELDVCLFHQNLDMLLEMRLPMYFTFTGIASHNAAFDFMCRYAPGYDFFHIDLIDYNASQHVDSVPWGARQ